MAPPVAAGNAVVYGLAVIVLFSASGDASASTSDVASCPSANGAAMVQMASFDLRAKAIESDMSFDQGESARRKHGAVVNRAQSFAAYNAYLHRKIVELSATKQPAVTELNDMIGHFIAQQSNSEDKCSSQLLEAKHQLNQLHVVINDLAAEINSTETSIRVTNTELTTKRDELEVVESWKVTELQKCEEIREERRKMLYTLQVEMTEMTHIAHPDVTMDISSGTVTTGVALLEGGAPDKISAAQALVKQTKTAAELLEKCVQSTSRNTTEAAETSADKNCVEQKEYLEKTYVTVYVHLTRLISEYEELIKSRSCETSVIQEYNQKVTPIRTVITQLVIRIETLTTKLKELRPRLQDAYTAESNLRVQITSLTESCALLPETVTDLDKVRETITALDKCPGLGAAEFNIPMWTKEWVVVRQSPSDSDAAFDAVMNKACVDKFADGNTSSVRVAQVSEIYASAIEGMPRTNTAVEAIVGGCPLCAGVSDIDTGANHPDGHARLCWQSGAALSMEGASKECSTGSRAVLCVYDRGDIRDVSSSSSSSASQVQAQL